LCLLGGGLRVPDRLHAIRCVDSRLTHFLTQNHTLV
jgi:hypothetical protein